MYNVNDLFQMYFEALYSCGLCTYNNCLPLELMKTLLSLYDNLPTNQKAVEKTIVLGVCSMFITDSAKPFEKYEGELNKKGKKVCF